MSDRPTLRELSGLPAAPAPLATATRELPGADGGVVPAGSVQAFSLASIADLFGVVVDRPGSLPG